MVGSVGAGPHVKKNVGGLHVTMHETSRMGRIEGARNLSDNSIASAGFRRLRWRRSLDTPLDVAHGDEEDVLAVLQPRRSG